MEVVRFRRATHRGLWALAGTLFLAGAALPLRAQTVCYQRSPYLPSSDMCGSQVTATQYEFNAANRLYFQSIPGDKEYLVATVSNDLAVYDVASPLSPLQLSSAHIPWDWSSINVGGSTHEPYVAHLRDMATVGGYPYAVVMLADYGWDYFRFAGRSSGFLGIGYHPSHVLSNRYVSAAEFYAAGAYWVAAQALDSASIADIGNPSDNSWASIRLYRLGTGGTPPGPATIGTGAVVVPIGHAGDPVDNTVFPLSLGSTMVYVMHVDARTFLLARTSSVRTGGVAVVDITNPAQPAVLWSSTDPTLVSGNWALDEEHDTLWVGDNAKAHVYGYRVDAQTGALSLIQDVTYYPNAGSVLFTNVSVAGNLLVATAGWKLGYVSLAGSGTPTVLPLAGVPYTDLPARACTNSGFQESATYLTAFVTGGHHYVARSMAYDQDIVAVSDGCISTVPLPDFTVTGGESAASCLLQSGAPPYARGFPGDVFTIKDNSAGVWTAATLDIQQGGQSIGSLGLVGGTFPMTVAPGFQVAWAPPASQSPGEFTIVLNNFNPVATPASASKVLKLCDNPKAALTVAVNGQACPNPAACAALVNDGVTLGSAGTTGNPSVAAGPAYYVLAPNAPNPTLGATFTATDPGNYAVGVVVSYTFPATNDPVCANNAALFGAVGTDTYHSCAVGTVTAGYGAASFQVEQPPGARVADASYPGSVLVDQPIVLRFTGRLAGGYNPELNWNIPGITIPQAWCDYTGWPASAPVCTIPANSGLVPGAAAAWNLSVDVCQTGGLGVPCNPSVQTVSAPAVSVQPTLNTFTFSVSPTNPKVGDTIRITLGTVIGTYSSLRFDLGGTSCLGDTQLGISCVTPFGNQCQANATLPVTFSYGPSERSKTDTVRATGTLTSGPQIVSPTTVDVTISAASATCPCPTVTATASGPSSALIGQNVQFSASASAPGYTITGYSWDFGDGATATGNPANHAYTRAGTFTATVTATSSCGNTGTGTDTIVIGTGGGGSLTLTPSPATANPGQRVTFTFSPGITTTGDRITFNFGDGSATQSFAFLPGLCSVSNPCNQMNYTYTQPSPAGGYTVTASGTAGGTSVSGSTSVTILNNCTAPAAPTASFTFAPAPRVGRIVQFTDTSTGTPTTWAWTFGGPGVSGTSIGTVHTAAIGNLTILAAPSTPSVGQAVVFTFSPALVQTGDRMTFDFGDGTQGTSSYNASLCPPQGCTQSSHTYTSAGQFTVNASGTAGGVPVSGATSVTVGGAGGGSLTITPSPASATVGQTVTFTFAPALSQAGDTVTLAFGDSASQTVTYPACQTVGGCNVASHAYAAANTYTVSGSGTAGGAGVTGNTTVAVSAAGTGGTSTAPSPTYTFSAAGTFTVTLTATNCKGSNTASQQVTVVPACDQTAKPAADFTWPTGAVAGFPEQQQPYAGQQITLTDASTGSPESWHWYDFNELKMDRTVTTPAFTFTWPANLAAGPKNVRMVATNCVGASAEVMKVVTIYPDVRHVVADFTWSDGPLATGTAVTLVAAQGPSNGDPDTFVWTFDDGGSPQSGASITHTFTCAGSHTVTLTASRSSYAAATATAAHFLTLTGQVCGPESVMTVDAAKLNGLNNTSWRTDVRIFNPSAQASKVTVEFLPVGYNNSSPSGAFVTLPAKGTWVLNNILEWAQSQGTVGTDVKKAALRVLYDNGEHVAPVVISQTYTSPPSGGGRFGQLTPGIEVVPNTTQPVLWITGVRNNGPTTGYRTNYSLVNLRDSATSGLKFTLFDATGKSLATQIVNLGALEYRQDSLVNLFAGAAAATSPDPLAVKVEVPAGSDVQAYTSVVDNLTGDPVLIPAVPPPASPIFLPAVAHTPGVGGTVWRSDMQITNPDSAPHTWAITYTPSGHDTLPIATQRVTIAAAQSMRVDDLLNWVYAYKLTDSDKTSGVIEIAPADGDSVYPIVQARSFNQTPNGTFGQNITPITPEMGAAAGQNRRLLLTGMSSQDIARTNFGFVNLSDDSGVNFAVTFYDESGNVLNKKDDQGNTIPYTFSLGVGGWDQDLLENRFKNAGWPALGSNLRAVSAVIEVTGGGPGTAYATVIDSQTGDPNFILAQATP